MEQMRTRCLISDLFVHNWREFSTAFPKLSTDEWVLSPLGVAGGQIQDVLTGI